MPRTALVKCYLEPEEKVRLQETARRIGMSTSTLAQKILTGQNINVIAEKRATAHAVLDLLKVNADLARLGNLFKLAISEDAMTTEKAHAVAEKILDAQFMLRQKIEGL